MKSLSLIIIALTFCVSFSQSQAQTENPAQKKGQMGKFLKRFQKMDADQDGRISLEEAKGRQKFIERFDQNQDGYVELKTELIPGLQKMGKHGKRRPPINQEAVFTALDTNQDGVISREEFMAKPLGKVIKKTMKGQKGNFMAKFDKNGDKQVTKDEVPELMLKHFGKFDLNGDSIITLAEIEELKQQRKQDGFAGKKGKKGKFLPPKKEPKEEPKGMSEEEDMNSF